MSAFKLSVRNSLKQLWTGYSKIVILEFLGTSPENFPFNIVSLKVKKRAKIYLIVKHVTNE